MSAANRDDLDALRESKAYMETKHNASPPTPTADEKDARETQQAALAFIAKIKAKKRSPRYCPPPHKALPPTTSLF